VAPVNSSRSSNHASVEPKVVCFPFLGDRVGGSHISALKLVMALDCARFVPLVVVHEWKGPAARLFEDHGIAVEAGPSLGRHAGNGWRVLARSLPLVRQLVTFLKARQVAIVHTNDGFSHVAWAVPARLADARHVWHHRTTPNSLGIRFVARWAAHEVVSVSQFAAPRPGLWSAAKKCSVVPSPFDTEWASIDRGACREAALAELGIPAETKLLGFFGNLVPRKRPLVFVEAIAVLRQMAPDLPVLGLLFGQPRQGLDEAVMRRADELGIASAIRLAGFRSCPERWLAACDALLVPAVDEPFGRALIEAMLLGTPVVATKSGGNPEALRDGQTGLLVPIDDPLALAHGAHALITRPGLRARISAAAQADALARFGIARHADAIMKIYDRLLAADPRSGRTGRQRMGGQWPRYLARSG
jgi:glycosyltransferase involved in cell wall biosynthesis